MKEKTKDNLMMILVFILVLGGTLFMMNLALTNTNEKLNTCAEEYGYKSRTNWDGGSSLLNYTHQYFNETHFACCLKDDYLLNGEVKNLNCTRIFIKSGDGEK